MENASHLFREAALIREAEEQFPDRLATDERSKAVFGAPEALAEARRLYVQHRASLMGKANGVSGEDKTKLGNYLEMSRPNPNIGPLNGDLEW